MPAEWLQACDKIDLIYGGLNMKTHLFSYLILVMLLVLCCASVTAYEVSAAGACSSPNSHPDAKGFYDKVRSFSGWTGNFYVEDNNSKEIHYKRVDMGGQNNSWVDSSDIHYHVSHGGTRWDSYYGKDLKAVLFEDGTSLVPSEARTCWGDSDLEWIAFRNCQLLNDVSRPYWANAMNGLHLILGFVTNSSKHDNFGKLWAEKMKKTTILWWTIPGQTITQAWFNTADATQPSGRIARVLAEVQDNYNDHLWGNGYVSPDPSVDNYYWYWDHTAGSPPYLNVNMLEMMYIYKVMPRTVNEEYVQQIGNAFGLQGPIGQNCESYFMADLSNPAGPRILEISKTTGHFHFHDDGKLFVLDPQGGKFPPEQALEVAQAFLSRNKLLPQDARAYAVEYDTLTEENYEKGTIRQRLTMNTNVVWARQIPADPKQTLVSVAGAGARLKIYLDKTGGIMGGLGNWRQIQPIELLEVNDSRKTWSFFDVFGSKIVLEPPLVEYDQAVPNFETAVQLYYEFSYDIQQAELIPCWLFNVDYYLKGKLMLTAETFIPASTMYMAPVVEIVKPEDSSKFPAGSMIGFDCEVASGLGTPPYSFQWTSSVDGVLSDQQTFQTDTLTVRCPDISMDCQPLPHTITVTVTDAKGLQSSDSIQITIIGPCDECKDPADFNQDKIVDLEDFAYWASRFLMQSGKQE